MVSERVLAHNLLTSLWGAKTQISHLGSVFVLVNQPSEYVATFQVNRARRVQKLDRHAATSSTKYSWSKPPSRSLRQIDESLAD